MVSENLVLEKVSVSENFVLEKSLSVVLENLASEKNLGSASVIIFVSSFSGEGSTKQNW